MYKIIVYSDETMSLPSIKWEKDLSIAPNTEFWTQICKNIIFMTKIANLQTIQYKTFHRTHYTRQKCSEWDLHIHATWNCTSVKTFSD